MEVITYTLTDGVKESLYKHRNVIIDREFLYDKVYSDMSSRSYGLSGRISDMKYREDRMKLEKDLSDLYGEIHTYRKAKEVERKDKIYKMTLLDYFWFNPNGNVEVEVRERPWYLYEVVTFRIPE